MEQHIMDTWDLLPIMVHGLPLTRITVHGSGYDKNNVSSYKLIFAHASWKPFYFISYKSSRFEGSEY